MHAGKSSDSGEEKGQLDGSSGSRGCTTGDNLCAAADSPKDEIVDDDPRGMWAKAARHFH